MSFIDPWFIPEPTAPIDVIATGTINNLPIVDLGGKAVSGIRFTGAAPVLTSMVPLYPGQRVHLTAVGGPLVIANESALGTAGYRFRTGTGADLVFGVDASAWAWFDATSQRWRLTNDGADGALPGVRGGVKSSILGELQTAAAGGAVTPLASYTMVDESLCAFDVVVTMARRSNVTKGGRYKRSVVYRRTGGAAPVIVGAIETGTDQETTSADDVTISVSGNAVRVMVTAADTDPRNWTCELRVQETLAT